MRIASGSAPKAASSRSTSSRAIPSTSRTGRRRRRSIGTSGMSRARRPSSVSFHKRMSLVNYSRTAFEIDVDRDRPAAAGHRSGNRARRAAGRRAPRRRVRERQHRDQRRRRAVDEGVGAAVGVDPGPVHPVARHDDRDPVRAGSGVGARPRGQRRLLRQGAAGSPGREGCGDPLQGRRAVSQQDRALAVARAVDRRQLRRRPARADAGAVHAPGRRARLRELDVGNPARAVQGRHAEQLQRRARWPPASRRSARSTSSRPRLRRSRSRRANTTPTPTGPSISSARRPISTGSRAPC